MSPQNHNRTILTILSLTSDYFKKHAVENPRLNAERLLAHVLKIDRLQLYLQFDRILDKNELADFRELVKRRAEHEPLQYLTGETEFMGLPFKVNPSVLIPRPETEILVQAVLELKDRFNQRTPVLWDIGTGSGCIAVSLAYLWPGLQVCASDISMEAIAVAEQNARQNRVENSIRFLYHDIFQAEPVEMNEIDIIVSNPPYICKDEILKLDREIRDYEPMIALTDAGDGTAFYRRIIEMLGSYPNCRFVLLEMSGTQPELIKSLLKNLSIDHFSIIRDLNGHQRVLKLET